MSDNEQAPWQRAISRHLTATADNGDNGIALLMPEYRPDICRGIAAGVGFEFFDFRREIMDPRKMSAHETTLAELDAQLEEKSRTGGLLAFNVESLLAIKPDRPTWLQRFAHHHWPNPILLPLTLFHADLPETAACIDLREYEFPPQSFISRLAM